jgi:hypothetical protein
MARMHPTCIQKVLAAVDGAQDSMAGLVLEPFHGSLSDVLQQQKVCWRRVACIALTRCGQCHYCTRLRVLAVLQL